jgi:hypothetical protein
MKQYIPWCSKLVVVAALLALQDLLKMDTAKFNTAKPFVLRSEDEHHRLLHKQH